MEKWDNYAVQTRQAKERFLTYDQQKLIRKYGLACDASHLYVPFLSEHYRICRRTGDFQRKSKEQWVDANSFHEVMTLLDLLCDAWDDRQLANRWEPMQNFGLLFHRNLLEDRRDPHAEWIERNTEAFCVGCEALGGESLSGCDVGYSIELFDGLRIALKFWHGDEEFAPRLRFFWDANALQYLRYETMYFAVGLLMERIREHR